MGSKSPVNIHWFRRDLRLDDNAALYHALKSEIPVLCFFIFDSEILDKLEDKKDHRLIFIHNTLINLKKELQDKGSELVIKYGKPETCWKELLEEYHVQYVFANHDYELYARKRDQEIEELLLKKHILFLTYKDQVIFEKDEVLKDDGKPYTIYTPFSRKWMSKLNDFYLSSYPAKNYFKNLFQLKKTKMISLSEMGFEEDDFSFPSKKVNESILLNYKKDRDYPGIKGTSHIGIHLRFGTVSIRKLAKHAKEVSDTWLNELCWREFYMCILWHFPHAEKSAFKPEYNKIQWRNNEQEFERWCNGTTGYPIVDAGMRELNETGFMHNRVRMIAASFLIKHLLIDWRWGEAYFAEKLLDYELASNNGGWQWSAGSGCDSAPYFRIFNPYEQTKKFDPDFKYIRKWVPEFEDFGYPEPIVDHKFARERCLNTYAKALKKE